MLYCSADGKVCLWNPACLTHNAHIHVDIDFSVFSSHFTSHHFQHHRQHQKHYLCRPFAYEDLITLLRQRYNPSRLPRHELIPDTWNGIRIDLFSLQDIMPPHVALSTQEPNQDSAKVKMPSAATRRAACTHLTMERLYGDFTCNVCNTSSYLGWVYCCTQDDCFNPLPILDSVTEPSSQFDQGNDAAGTIDGVVGLPTSDQDAAEDARSQSQQPALRTAELSPSVKNAIKEGHYTTEQIQTLREQKQKVVDTATAAITMFEQIQGNNEPSSTTLPPVGESTSGPSLYYIAACPGSTASRPTAIFPYCKYRACQLCRPTYRDRTWQCFEHTQHAHPPLYISDQDPRLSLSSLLRTIGLRSLPPASSTRPGKPFPPQPPSPDHTLRRLRNSRSALTKRFKRGETSMHDHAAAGAAIETELEALTQQRMAATAANHNHALFTQLQSADIADAYSSPEEAEPIESRGFRESMKRALRSMLMSRRPSARSLVGLTRRRALRGGRESSSEETEEDAREFDMGLWKELNDELLREAAGVALPGERVEVNGDGGAVEEEEDEDEDEGEGEEVGVRGGGGVEGVAVTEEAVETGVVDVVLGG